MALMPGKNEVVIVETAIREVSGKDVIKVYVRDDEDESHHLSIYITPATIEKGMLKAQLALLGFNEAEHKLSDLEENPTLFAGKRVPVMMGEYNGRPRLELLLNAAPTKKKLRELNALFGGSDDTAPGDDDLPF